MTTNVVHFIDKPLACKAYKLDPFLLSGLRYYSRTVRLLGVSTPRVPWGERCGFFKRGGVVGIEGVPLIQQHFVDELAGGIRCKSWQVAPVNAAAYYYVIVQDYAAVCRTFSDTDP